MRIVRDTIILWFFLIFMIIPVLATHSSVELRTRLNFINSFYAQFIQKITDSTGIIVQENHGELWIQHPNSFNYHIIFPEEIYLISNGTVLWFYDLSLNQVVVRSLKDVVDNIFFRLFLNAETLDCHEYDIHKDGDIFFLIPKNNQDIDLKKIEIQITNQGKIEKFSIFNKENQCINYQLTNHSVFSYNVEKFNFSPPNGVMIDEQR